MGAQSRIYSQLRYRILAAEVGIASSYDKVFDIITLWDIRVYRLQE